MSTGVIRMVCLHFYTLLVQWTFTTLRVYQAHSFDVMLQFCVPYVCLYSKCGQSISWLLTSVDSLSLPTSRVKQSKKRISCEMSVYKSQEHELLKLDNISSKKLYAGEFNIILMGVMLTPYLSCCDFCCLTSFILENVHNCVSLKHIETDNAVSSAWDTSAQLVFCQLGTTVCLLTQCR